MLGPCRRMHQKPLPRPVPKHGVRITTRCYWGVRTPPMRHLQPLYRPHEPRLPDPLRRSEAAQPRGWGLVARKPEGIAATTFYDRTMTFLADCAVVLQGQGDAKGAERFHKASAHWMQHSHASHPVASGTPIDIAQRNLGHASLAANTVSVTTGRRRRMTAVEALWGKVACCIRRSSQRRREPVAETCTQWRRATPPGARQGSCRLSHAAFC